MCKTLLRLNHAVVIKERDDPSARVAIDEIFHISVDVDGCRISSKMDQQVRNERRDAFIFAEQIANADKHNFATPDFVDCD